MRPLEGVSISSTCGVLLGRSQNFGQFFDNRSKRIPPAIGHWNRRQHPETSRILEHVAREAEGSNFFGAASVTEQQRRDKGKLDPSSNLN